MVTITFHFLWNRSPALPPCKELRSKYKYQNYRRWYIDYDGVTSQEAFAESSLVDLPTVGLKLIFGSLIGQSEEIPYLTYIFCDLGINIVGQLTTAMRG